MIKTWDKIKTELVGWACRNPRPEILLIKSSGIAYPMWQLSMKNALIGGGDRNMGAKALFTYDFDK